MKGLIMPKCIYCDKDFIIKPTGVSGGRNRQLCYDCLPEGCSQEEIQNAAKYYIRKRTAKEKIQRGCDICGYNKSAWALEWHHSEDNKDYNPSSLLGKGNREALELYYKETSKCMLLCCNCHREIHEQLQSIPFKKPVGSNKYEEFRQLVKKTYLEVKSINKTAELLHKDPSSIKVIIEFLNLPLFNQNSGIKVAMLDKKTEEVLQIFPTISEAAIFVGKDPRGSHIGEVCAGKRKSACGYKWKYIN